MKKHILALFHKFRHCLAFGYFVTAILCLCFVYGFAVGNWHLFPHSFLNNGCYSLIELLDKPKLPHYLNPARYEGQGVIVCESEQVCTGVTLITGRWRDGGDWNTGIRLVDLYGRVLHEWKCGKTYPNIHGALLLPGGDVIFNLEHVSLIRMNANSKVVWKLPIGSHHSIFQDCEGKYWVCGRKYHENNIPVYVGLKPPFYEDTILRVSPGGVIEREISLLDVIYKSGYDGLLRSHSGDILHLNDVEVLSEEMADAFELFQAGDIMVSMRDINSVFVIDGETEQIKWSLTSPFIRQHDPDFTEDGYITVFDNHADLRSSQYEEQGNRIIRIEPSTKRITTLYGWEKNQYFFTRQGGKHQHLRNGNILITEAQAGRIFEVNTEGKVVWSWIAPRWDEKNVPEIMQGTRYDAEFADFISQLGTDAK